MLYRVESRTRRRIRRRILSLVVVGVVAGSGAIVLRPSFIERSSRLAVADHDGDFAGLGGRAAAEAQADADTRKSGTTHGAEAAPDSDSGAAVAGWVLAEPRAQLHAEFRSLRARFGEPRACQRPSRRLLELGCDYGQGFGYAPALSPEEAEVYLAESCTGGAAPLKAMG